MAGAGRLLPNRTLARLARARLQAVGRRTARGCGMHATGRGGTGADIADYRDYAAGDDLRHLDWHAFARLGKPYLRLHRREEDRHLVLIIDDSRSMASAGKETLARRLAAGLAVAGLHGDERVSVLTHAGELLPPVRGRAAIARALGALSLAPPPGARRRIDRLCADAAARGRRGIAVVFSDFLDDGDPAAGLHRLAIAGLEPWAVQILAAGERDPDPPGDADLIDAETGATLAVDSDADLLHRYRAALRRLEGLLAAAARTRAGRFLGLAADADPERVLLRDLMQRGWLA